MKNSNYSYKVGFVIIIISTLIHVLGNTQNAIVGTGFSDGWGGLVCPTGNTNFKFMGDSGISGTYILTTNASGTGDRFFRFGIDWSTTTAQRTLTIGSDEDVTPGTKYTLNPTCAVTGAMRYNVTNIAYNYVFKTLNAGTDPTGTFVFFLKYKVMSDL